MALRLATPGVYIEEKSAFPNSVVGLPTAVPAFIGYTEKAVKGNGKSAINQAVRITSLGEYHTYFGMGIKGKYNIREADETAGDYDFKVDDKAYLLERDDDTQSFFYDSIRLFFQNGGATCHIVSVGTYGSDGKNEIKKAELEAGVLSLIKHEEPTLLVIPEAVLLEEADCYALQQAMVNHCGYKMQNRFAILDVYDGYKPRTYDEEDVITRFREGIGINFLNFGAAYYPWLLTSVVQADEISYKNIGSIDVLQDILNAEVDASVSDSAKADEVKAEIAKMADEDADVLSVNQTLVAVSSTFKNIMTAVRNQINVLPPSAAMAGIYTMVDNSRGVWKAPANVSVNSVIAPVVNLTSDDQEDLNVTLSGKSINAIRPFIGEGVLVWGARTLDGNSKDWRYINVRRTMIFIEQSIKYAAKAYVFEPNVSNTWVTMKSMISGFLSNVWKQGGLAGATPDAAYEVYVGLGSTMTPDDILDGIMRITVKVAVTRPAEFIVITFQQKMQES
ncbi:MAG: phage tail sheath family protein [Bernardetiaceae bacterium]|nr:phage tail sheath family protein [Bernardetiaceae bacterium]